MVRNSQNWIRKKIYRSRFVVFIFSFWRLRFPKLRWQRRQKKIIRSWSVILKAGFFFCNFFSFLKLRRQKRVVNWTFVWSAFWDNRYFWHHSPLKRIFFPISVSYNISYMAMAIAPSFTPRGDRHVRSGSFLLGILFSTTFIWSVFCSEFWYNRYFWQLQP